MLQPFKAWTSASILAALSNVKHLNTVISSANIASTISNDSPNDDLLGSQYR
ncbi:hypothetical protein SK128_009553 [Halocaridina rubra]|uniref:Uncharacterized protein n=1 Tax=Halocaridina rubra TaxID=373956 RepID=A0AAN9A7Y4_HALRR